MMKATLEQAANRLTDARQAKVCILDSGRKIIFTEYDFQDGGSPPVHVWFYVNRLAVACVDLRSVAAIAYDSAIPEARR